MMGVSHHFLLFATNCHISARKPGRFMSTCLAKSPPVPVAISHSLLDSPSGLPHAATARLKAGTTNAAPTITAVKIA
jgi:hypothetical protein